MFRRPVYFGWHLGPFKIMKMIFELTTYWRWDAFWVIQVTISFVKLDNVTRTWIRKPNGKQKIENKKRRKRKRSWVMEHEQWLLTPPEYRTLNRGWKDNQWALNYTTETFSGKWNGTHSFSFPFLSSESHPHL